MANYIIIILLLYIILKDFKPLLFEKKQEKVVDEVKEHRIKQRQREFENILNYSIDTAIESKRGER